MKSLLLQKLYRLHRVYVYGMIVSLLLFEVGMLALSRVSDAVHVDFWVTGGVLCFMLLSMTIDTGEHWAKCRAVMPVSCRQIVRAEYLFLLMADLVFTLLVSLFPLIEMLLNGAVDGKQLFFGSVTVWVASLLLYLLITPVVMRFGDKGFAGFSIGLLVLCFIAGFFFSDKLTDFLTWLEDFLLTHDLAWLALGELVIIAVLTLLSYLAAFLLLPRREY